jgi:hypothetical protein
VNQGDRESPTEGEEMPRGQSRKEYSYYQEFHYTEELSEDLTPIQGLPKPTEVKRTKARPESTLATKTVWAALGASLSGIVAVAIVPDPQVRLTVVPVCAGMVSMATLALQRWRKR